MNKCFLDIRRDFKKQEKEEEGEVKEEEGQRDESPNFYDKPPAESLSGKVAHNLEGVLIEHVQPREKGRGGRVWNPPAKLVSGCWRL